MLPTVRSTNTGTSSSAIAVHSPACHTSAAASSTVQAAMNTCHGSRWIGAVSWANAGE
jgi:hypothetical protein